MSSPLGAGRPAVRPDRLALGTGLCYTGHMWRRCQVKFVRLIILPALLLVAAPLWAAEWTELSGGIRASDTVLVGAQPTEAVLREAAAAGGFHKGFLAIAFRRPVGKMLAPTGRLNKKLIVGTD